MKMKSNSKMHYVHPWMLKVPWETLEMIKSSLNIQKKMWQNSEKKRQTVHKSAVQSWTEASVNSLNTGNRTVAPVTSVWSV